MKEKTFNIIQLIITFLCVGVIVAFYNTLNFVVLGGIIALFIAIYNLVAVIYYRKIETSKSKSSMGLFIISLLGAVFIFLTL